MIVGSSARRLRIELRRVLVPADLRDGDEDATWHAVTYRTGTALGCPRKATTEVTEEHQRRNRNSFCSSSVFSVPLWLFRMRFFRVRLQSLHVHRPAPKSWQARIAEATDALAQSFVESISYDRRLYKHDIAGSIAHATMLAKVGLITDAERDAIVAGPARSIERDIEAGNFQFDESLEDIHMVVEAELIKRIGEPGRKLHTGRSRNDQVATDLALWIDDVAQTLADASSTISAERSSSSPSDQRDVVMPSLHASAARTADLAGAEALAWAQMFERDCERSSMHRRRHRLRSIMPLGSGAIAGTSLPIDPRSHCVDAASMADAHRRARRTASSAPRRAITRATFVYACAMIAQHLSRWAEQWIIYMTTEFGFIKIADRYTTVAR